MGRNICRKSEDATRHTICQTSQTSFCSSSVWGIKGTGVVDELERAYGRIDDYATERIQGYTHTLSD